MSAPITLIGFPLLERFVGLCRQGRTLPQIARELGISIRAAYRYRRMALRLSLPLESPPPQKEAPISEPEPPAPPLPEGAEDEDDGANADMTLQEARQTLAKYEGQTFGLHDVLPYDLLMAKRIVEQAEHAAATAPPKPGQETPDPEAVVVAEARLEG